MARYGGPNPNPTVVVGKEAERLSRAIKNGKSVMNSAGIATANRIINRIQGTEGIEYIDQESIDKNIEPEI